MEAKNNFLRKVMPLVKSARSLAHKKEVVVAEDRAESHAELRSLREENRALWEQVLELTEPARGKSPVRPFVRYPLSCLEVYLSSVQPGSTRHLSGR